RKHYEKVILVINSGSSVDISDIDDCKPDAVIFFCQEGLEGGRALASLLTGEENFSGKLSDTWVYSYEDIPFGNEFSYMNGNTAREYYKEGIYVGYRYYDTFNVPVRYHFGYGLSYTDFEMTVRAVTLQGKDVEMEVCVRNTGKVAGKETVQVYVSAPTGKLDKEYQRLVAFGKTKNLQPGETEILKLCFDMEYCASYDQQENCFILEKGNYIIRIGNSSDNTVIAAAVWNEETIVISRHGDLLKCEEEFEELHSPQRKEEIPEGIKVLKLDGSCFETKICEYPGMTAADDDKVKEIIRNLTREEKIKLVMGESNDDRGLSTKYIYTPGTVARTTEDLMSKGVINTNLADGPAGLRLLKESALDKDGNIKYLKDNFPVAAMELFLEAQPLEETDTVLYQYPTAWPAATALAQSFNTDLIEEIGMITSEEMVEFNVTFWLAPGMNIHKNPLCGRNFEYYSEDPVLSGRIASALLKGVRTVPGNYITIKHFACNNAEDNRSFTDSVVKQRALREIYLRGFEIAVKEGRATGLMTSYNKINGVYAPDSYDLA
ncbi:MAG: fibronectin type III-like domain-contianing protein, partial [Erysipelotrichaceae bacterium]|nr:fibronectin type III-like domain-contianing protein [Erysipelotrichaceae bacterium]